MKLAISLQSLLLPTTSVPGKVLYYLIKVFNAVAVPPLVMQQVTERIAKGIRNSSSLPNTRLCPLYTPTVPVKNKLTSPSASLHFNTSLSLLRPLCLTTLLQQIGPGPLASGLPGHNPSRPLSKATRELYLGTTVLETG